MKNFRLSPRAVRSLDQIADFGRDQFGPKQSTAYVRDLLGRCRDLARGRVPHRACRDVFAPDARADLRFARSGRHVIVFVETPGGPLILDFLHQSVDLTRRLETPD
jgi:toxin ParE1/3/4